MASLFFCLCHFELHRSPGYLPLPFRAAAQIRRYNQGRVAALAGVDWLSSASCTVSRLTWGA